MSLPESPRSYSFSGADCRAYCWFPERPAYVSGLDTLHTVSVSVHEAKGQARSLGFRGIRGMSRGIRTVAGSIIFVVVEDHPLRALQKQFVKWMEESSSDSYSSVNPSDLGWSFDRDLVGVGAFLGNYNYNNRLGVTLPPFDLALEYVAEAGGYSDNGKSHAMGAGCLIRGIEFIDEGIVTSVNDPVTEVTFSYIAYDYKPLSSFDLTLTQEAELPAVDVERQTALQNFLWND